LEIVGLSRMKTKDCSFEDGQKKIYNMLRKAFKDIEDTYKFTWSDEKPIKTQDGSNMLTYTQICI